MNDYYDQGGGPSHLQQQNSMLLNVSGEVGGGSASSTNSNGSAQASGSSHPPPNKERFQRENHSEIERRRRNKMTHYINELAEMVPQVAALGRKPDKLTILRMAVSHMKQIREVSCPSDPNLAAAVAYKPSFLTDQELKHMILEAANGFLFVLACDTGRVLYVADSILPVLNLRQEDWLQHSIYDLVHPDDMDKVRDQLSGSDVQMNRTLDLKSGTVKKESKSGPSLHMTCRRGFICRMRLGNIEPLHRLRNRRPLFTHNGQTYVVMHCTGYIKNTPPMGVEATQSSCLVGVARLQVASMPMVKQDGQDSDQFCMRTDEQGKITFVDQRIVQLLGLRTEDIINKQIWQCVHAADEPVITEAFRQLISGGQQSLKVNCRWNKADGLAACSIDAYKFLNPYSDQFEYVVVTVRLLDTVQPDAQPLVVGAPITDEQGYNEMPEQIPPKRSSSTSGIIKCAIVRRQSVDKRSANAIISQSCTAQSTTTGQSIITVVQFTNERQR
ncbi:Helix-loop-helix DNA-binding domain protein [Aphelenchoides bicaudatus]|nr:Helix-loop-helix DNA-binding domain protein [Aphelenchoides bicaudatus]